MRELVPMTGHEMDIVLRVEEGDGAIGGHAASVTPEMIAMVLELILLPKGPTRG